MVATGRVDTLICDDILQQFRSFLYEDVAANKQEFLDFDPRDKDQRIESFLRYVSNHIQHFCFQKEKCGRQRLQNAILLYVYITNHV